ncbi:MAG: hypothetical protein V4664_02390 [Patescibacteria group bacterium]
MPYIVPQAFNTKGLVRMEGTNILGERKVIEIIAIPQTKQCFSAPLPWHVAGDFLGVRFATYFEPEDFMRRDGHYRPYVSKFPKGTRFALMAEVIVTLALEDRLIAAEFLLLNGGLRRDPRRLFAFSPRSFRFIGE